MWELVLAHERTNHANITSVSIVAVAPKLIRFLVVSMVTHGYLFYYRNLGVICSHRLAYSPCQFVEHSGHSQIQQPVFQTQC